MLGSLCSTLILIIIIKSKAGLNNFKISIKEWHEKTNAIGIVARAGRYGGTYAHKDIAFNFCMWISPVFQLYVVREYQRLVELERSELAVILWVVGEGIAYITGAVLYSFKKVPYIHSIFHVFVILGDLCHMIATWKVLQMFVLS